MVKYFCGELCDDKSSVRLLSTIVTISFDQFLGEKDVSLVNCQVCEAQGGPEVLLTNATNCNSESENCWST